MSQKWRRSQQWDREHFPPWAWPARLLLHTFSSIPLAVVLLLFVVLYATVASVPIGMLALIPTFLLYGLTLLVAVALSLLPLIGLLLALRGALGPGARFVLGVLGGMALAAGAVWAWHAAVWPALRYEPATGHGVRLFAAFCDRYKATTLRRLPGMEMSELEFYGWWPLRVVLLLFVTNMIVATVRRIEFTFVNIGVLTVHTGIILIALGSIYYHRFKLEGDTILLAGETDAKGVPTPGPPQGFFFDNTLPALWVSTGHRADWIPLTGVPRYNDYNLGAGPASSVLTAIHRLPAAGSDGGRSLDLPVRASARLDPDLSFRIVGYAVYADPAPDWVRGDPAAAAKPNPARFVTLLSTDEAATGVRAGPVADVFLLPDRPQDRVSENDAFGIEWTRGMDPARWADLSTPLPDGTLHALLVEVPAAADHAAYKAVYPVGPNTDVAVGDTGWRLNVKQLAAQPPFPIITEGYRDANSSMAIVRLTGPDGKSFDRWLYHRFPEISQDMLDEVNDRGMPKRRDASPAIRVSYLDVSKLQVYLDEAADGTVRAIVRQPRGRVRTAGGLRTGSQIADLVPGIGLRIGEFWEHVDAFDRPRVVPESQRDKEDVGNHGHAMLAVEVAGGTGLQPVGSGPGHEGTHPAKEPGAARTVVWLPFSRYFGVPGTGDTTRTVRLPDGRMIALGFGRLPHQLPGFMVQLLDFTMEAYDHRGAPRDYRSMVRVLPTDDSFEPYEHLTQLNAPLQAPFEWLDDRRSWLANAWGTVRSRLSPMQFKFSQAGWDRSGWEQTQAAADRGEVPRPFARFTILQVGNNPGIHVIAAGGILMSVGIPWAFYVKPWLLRRRKHRLEADLARGRAVPASPHRARAAVVPDLEPSGDRRV
ncbi:MAG: hypothetical protein IT437_06450 [Phycisphaerales bacterium]|nr:hypothetical protein [Phycisphaerales bacterium]